MLLVEAVNGYIVLDVEECTSTRIPCRQQVSPDVFDGKHASMARGFERHSDGPMIPQISS